MYINVKDFGAIGDGKINDTVAIQKAIDSGAESGKIVYFPKGIYKTATLFLKSHTHLEISSTAIVQSVDDLSLYSEDIPVVVEAPSFTKCLLYANNCTDIQITGKGMIDGRGELFPKNPRPMLIRFENCTKILLRDVYLKNSASWCFHMIKCSDVSLDSINIYNHAQVNNDGIDLDGCKNVTISNCDLNTADDSICPKSTTETLCENIAISNCNLSSKTAVLKLGTSSKSGFRNITMTGCNVYNCPMGVIKLLAVDGGRVENVVISNITMDKVGSPLFIRLGKRNLTYQQAAEMDHSKDANKNDNHVLSFIRNIIITNIVANVDAELKRTPICLMGLEESNIQNVTLSNIDVTFNGGGTKEDRENVVDEDPYRYPEQGFFGVLPVWGIFARHVDELNISNMKLRLKNNDERDVSRFYNIKELTIKDSNV